MRAAENLIVTMTCAVMVGGAQAEVIFSYDASGGEMPTSQGWQAYNIQTGTTVGVDANAGMTSVGSENVLHIRDYTQASGFRLPNFSHGYVDADNNDRSQDLLEHGMRITVVYQANGSQSGNGWLLVGTSGTAFEAADNIGTGQYWYLWDLGAGGTGVWNTLVVTGMLNENNEYVFSTSLNGFSGPWTLIPAAAGQPELADVFSFGCGSTSGTGTDLYVKSVVVEVLPEPASSMLLVSGVGAVLFSRRRAWC